MTNKSAGSTQVITLPKGGGALHGIGEKFAPDLHTGTGNFTVPLGLPPGRNGFQPQISLTYSSGHGNGFFGLGWSLSSPGVSRQTGRGVPRYDDTQDVFVLSGAEDLVPVGGSDAHLQAQTESRQCYRPRTEGLFARIEHVRARSAEHVVDDHWEVRGKDGLVSLYGTPASAENDPAASSDPANPAHIFAWNLTQTRDPFDNLIEYAYSADEGVVDSHRWKQPRLHQIRYADYMDEGETRFVVSVTFEYEDRPDPFSVYRAGFEVRTTTRCRRIKIRTDTDKQRAVRTYRFQYENDALNGVSLLRSIQVIGHDDAGAEVEELPAVEFGYSRLTPERRELIPICGADLPPASLAHGDYELVDLYGNGLTDVLEMNGSVRYWRNLGEGRFDRPRAMKDAPAGLRLADPGVQMLDADGDGRADLLVTSGNTAGYFPLRFGGGWDRRSFQSYAAAPSFDLEDPEVKLVDLDGDGLTDVIRSGARLECFFNDRDPEKAWRRTRPVERRSPEAFPNVPFSDPHVKWADMTGDGLQDIVLVYDGRVAYWPNLGHGDWGSRVHMRASPRLPVGYDPRRILLGDVDGDGVADLVYADDGRVILWINRGGNAWSEPIVVNGTPRVSSLDAVRLTDLRGSGVAGVLWSADATGSGRPHMQFLDFTGGRKPYLLNEMDNHLGAVTKVEYAPSTRFYLEDERRPDMRWKTPLPFPVQVVARVEAIDAISGGKLTTEYVYHHGYWDGAEREFRGFGMVEQLDTEDFETFHAAGLHQGQTAFAPVNRAQFSPPTCTKTWFHQGPVGDEFGGWVEPDLSAEFWSGDPPLLTRPQHVTDLVKSLPRRVQRDALRTLRGTVLRTELYAQDGSDRQQRPYTVTETQVGVYAVGDGARPTLFRGPADLPANWMTDSHTPRIFYPHTLGQRTTQWERGDEPLTQFTFAGDHDDYGQARMTMNLAVPRGRAIRSVDPNGEPYLATRIDTTFAQRDDDQWYVVDRVARTCTYEMCDDGGLPPADFWEAVKAAHTADSPAYQRELIGQTLTFYDGEAFVGSTFGTLGVEEPDTGIVRVYGAPTRIETLVLTPDVLHAAYRSGSAPAGASDEPPYLRTDSPAVWPPEYPKAFQETIPALAGYTYQSGGGTSPYARGFYAARERRRYDFHDDPKRLGRGLIRARRDPLGYDTTVIHDQPYNLFPTTVTDPAGLSTNASYDYRVFQTSATSDPNGNRQKFIFSPLGLLAGTFVSGKAARGEGDERQPSTSLDYDFLAFSRDGSPISVRTVRRIWHDTQDDLPPAEQGATIATLEYSDGFGRVLQTRTQAEDVIFGDPVFGNLNLSDVHADLAGHSSSGPVPRVVVSGWNTYDNKGRAVEKYEPCFAEGWAYAHPTDEHLANSCKASLYYDPRDHVIRTVNPDGSEQRVIHGVPADLSEPDKFIPTPWETFTYDANDNAGRTHPDTADRYRDHWNTAASATIDALGRIVETVVRNGPRDVDEYRTRSSYDIRGNLLQVWDALDRLAVQRTYDLANRTLREEQLDSGVQRAAIDAAGNVLEQQDAKGAIVLRCYDVLQRPTRLWARDNSDEPVTLRDCWMYGDAPGNGLPSEAARERNLLGKLWRQYDEAGVLTFEVYDFKGNLQEKVRQVVKDEQILADFEAAPSHQWRAPAFRMDWQPVEGETVDEHATVLLDALEYRTSFAYDALNRVASLRYPVDAAGVREMLLPAYNRAGVLERVTLGGTVYVERIAYNAKGQRTLVSYGNSVMTRYEYEPRTFRLGRLRTEAFSAPAPLTYRPAGAVLQDFGYDYDLAGNILDLHDATPGSGMPPSLDHLERSFTYDPLYRLRSANGRECDIPLPTPWEASPRCIDPTKTRKYTEHYDYDPAGNITQLRHEANCGDFSRVFTFVGNTDRLATVTVRDADYLYTYDPSGNLTSETSSRYFEWDHSNRLRLYRTQSDGSEPSVHAQYLYDASGQRAKKLVRKQGGRVEVTVYIDGFFEHHHLVQAGGTLENCTLHVMDGQTRIALIRVGEPFADNRSPAVQYHVGDHLCSSNVVLDAAGVLVNREEYTPYGETSFGSFARKGYRFTGKERDEESGLSYHGARYYAPWLGRWLSVDPASTPRSLNTYGYVSGSPLTRVDPNGAFEVNWMMVGKGALVAGLAIAATVVIVATVGAAAGPIAGGVALYVGASAETAAVAATVAGGVVEASALAAGVVGTKELVQSTAEVLSGRELATNRRMSDDERSEKLGELAVSWAVVGLFELMRPPRPAGRAPQPSPAQQPASAMPKIPHSSGRPLTVRDFNRGGKANETMLNEGLNRLGVRTVQQKAVRDASGKVMTPRRHPDNVPIDIEGGKPLDLTTPAELSSSRKRLQMSRDVQHAEQSPVRGVVDDAGQFIQFKEDITHVGGYAIMPDTSGVKN